MLELTDTAMAHHTGFAFATVYAIQYLKDSKWFPWMWSHTDRVNRIVSVATALVTAAGVKFTAASASPDAGTNITIHLPTMLMMVYGIAVHFSAQFGLQEVFYRTAVKHATKHTASKRQPKRPALQAAA